jgi:hypothetical protein
MSRDRIERAKRSQNSLDSIIYRDIPVGTWTYGSIGMGRDVVCRNNNGRFEYFTVDSADPSVPTTDLYMTKNFIHGYRKNVVYEDYRLL